MAIDILINAQIGLYYKNHLDYILSRC